MYAFLKLCKIQRFAPIIIHDAKDPGGGGGEEGGKEGGKEGGREGGGEGGERKKLRKSFCYSGF